MFSVGGNKWSSNWTGQKHIIFWQFPLSWYLDIYTHYYIFHKLSPTNKKKHMQIYSDGFIDVKMYRAGGMTH